MFAEVITSKYLSVFLWRYLRQINITLLTILPQIVECLEFVGGISSSRFSQQMWQPKPHLKSKNWMRWNANKDEGNVFNATEWTLSKRLDFKGQTTIGFKYTFQRFTTGAVSTTDKFQEIL